MTGSSDTSRLREAAPLAEMAVSGALARPPETMWTMFRQRFVRHRPAMVSLVVLLFLVVACFGVSLFVSEDEANLIDVQAMRSPPSWEHPFGTDDVGRDMFLRTLFGGQISLRIGLLAACISVVIGIAVGTISGYNTGWIDNVLMRITDALLSIPTLFILIVLTRVLGDHIGVGNIAFITLVIGTLSWMPTSRIVRAQVLSLKERDFVLGARSLGCQAGRILVRHIVPNTLAPVVVAATLDVGRAIIFEASLSFLGLGIQPPTATWGSMLNRAQAYLLNAPWIALFPGVMILITVLCVNFLGDGLRDAFDPHSLR